MPAIEIMNAAFESKTLTNISKIAVLLIPVLLTNINGDIATAKTSIQNIQLDIKGISVMVGDDHARIDNLDSFILQTRTGSLYPLQPPKLPSATGTTPKENSHVNQN